MKKYFYSILLLSLITITLHSCSSENNLPREKVTLRFPNEDSQFSRSGDSLLSFIDVEVYIKSLEPFKLESEQIEELNAKDSISNQETYGYIIKEIGALRWGSSRGYFFDNNSGCMIYGTMYYGDNGINLFVPASTATRLLFSDICPPRGSSWAKQKKIKNE
jgi:hypothetical protein